MLEDKLDVWSKREIRLRASQPPDDGAVGVIDLVDGASVPSRRQLMAVSAFGDRINVEVVPGGGTVMSDASLVVDKWKAGFFGRTGRL